MGAQEEGILDIEWISNKPADKFQEWQHKSIIKALLIMLVFFEICCILLYYTLFSIFGFNIIDFLFCILVPTIAILIIYYVIIDFQKLMISEVSFGDEKLLCKTNSGKTITIPYNIIDSIGPLRKDILGINTQPEAGELFSISLSEIIKNGFKIYHVNPAIANKLLEITKQIQ